ncbi:MAG: transcription antitermination factor NusB [Clostridia bacterium]|nr:transcription antitermination factor NusB [Clostridia bacterium]
MAINRRKEREIVYQMLFASQFYPEEETPGLYEVMIPQMDEGAQESEYVKRTFFGARAYADKAMEKIEGAARDWKVERLSKGTLTVLQLALYEMECAEDVPVKIAINEAVELTKRFCEDGAKKFVNGILGSLAD